MSPDKVVYMANQIGKFFANQGEEKAVRGGERPSDEVLAPAHRAAIIKYTIDGGTS